VASLWWDRHRGEEQIDELVAMRAIAPAGRIRATTVKIMVDGVLENRSAALLDPYLDAGDDRGLTYLEAEALDSAVARLDALGFQVHMHAIGDRAARMALDAVEGALRANGRRDARHHVAHLQVVQPSDVPRFRDLGVVANCQPYWAQIEPQMTELTVPFLGAERADLQYPFRSLHDAGATLAFGSDWSVTTPDPFQLIEVAVTRVDPEHRDHPSFLPHERLELPDAIAAATMGSAFVQRNERERGSIEVGKAADLVVVDRNVFADGPIGDARVELTMVDGRVVHDVAR